MDQGRFKDGPEGASPAEPVGAALDEDAGGKLFGASPLPTRTRPAPVRSPGEAWAELRGMADGTSAALDEAPPAMADAAYAVELSRRLSRTLSYARFRKAASPFVEWLAGSQGPLLAAQTISGLYFENYHRASLWNDALSVALRRAAPQAPEAAYDELLAWCLEQCQDADDWRKAAYFAFVLADDRPASHALQPLAVLDLARFRGVEAGSEPFLLPLIVDAPPAEAAAWRNRRKIGRYRFTFSVVDAATAGATVMAVARAKGAPAAPSLAWLLSQSEEQVRGPIAEAILETREKGALAELAPFLREQPVRQALDRAADAYPAFVFRECLAVNAPEDLKAALLVRLADLVGRHGPEQARRWAEGFDGEAASRLETLFAAEFAPLEALPAIFRDPPWRRKKSRRAKEAAPDIPRDDIVLSVQPIPTPFSCPLTGKPWTPKNAVHVNCPVKDMKDLPGFLARTEKGRGFGGGNSDLPPGVAPPPDLPEDEALGWLASRLTVLSGKDFRASFRLTAYTELFRTMDRLPEPLALMLWEQPELALDSLVDWANMGPMMLSRFGERALPGLLKLIEARPGAAFGFAVWVDAPEIAPMAARAHTNPRLKKGKTLAADWLRRHRRTALTRLIPDAVGAPGEARDAAGTVLRWIVRQDARAAGELSEAVAGYAAAEPRVREAVGQVLNRDPLGEHPAKVAKPPRWVVPAALSRPRLRGGGVLPDEAVTALVEMLSFSRPGEVYAGIALAREICTPESLSAFAWDLFSVWLANGAANKEAWALRAVGWLGDDGCARKLTDLIRKWPWKARSRRAAGLDALADIGSPLALMNLNGVAERARSANLGAEARERFAAVAEARGLSPEDLADRVVLELGLDERGGLDLNFGRRWFRVEFDEFLKPWVKNAKGARLRAFPKPGKSDDAELAAAAVSRWLAVKKDAAAVAEQQLIRLEAMLATSRRVRPDVFWTFFASHPLIRPLAQRLVWGFYEDFSTATWPRLIFRVGSDLTFADSRDHPVALDLSPEAGGAVGLAHPLHMGEAGSRVWSELFIDYEIAQPFPQLRRETFVLTDAEKNSCKINRFEGMAMKPNSLLRVIPRGWTLLNPTPNSRLIERPVRLVNGEGAKAMLSLNRGSSLTLGGFELKDEEQQNVPLGELDDATMSEALRDLTQFIEAGKE